VYKLQVTFLRLVCVAVFALSSFYCASAQSTVFNIPSTDVQTARRFYVEADFMAHFSSYETGGYQLYGPRVVYGLSRRAEIGVNAFLVNTTPAEPIEIQPNFKFRFYENEEKGVAAAAGVLSKNIKGSHGPRITAGGYRLIGSFEPGTSKQGLLVGYEQPITRKLTFVTDWSSGNNDYGYVTAGVGLALSRKSLLYAGYNIGNQGRGNNSFGIFYGYSF
jgi:hypothetical protein